MDLTGFCLQYLGIAFSIQYVYCESPGDALSSIPLDA